jgi:peroxiredoxin
MITAVLSNMLVHCAEYLHNAALVSTADSWCMPFILLQTAPNPLRKLPEENLMRTMTLVMLLSCCLSQAHAAITEAVDVPSQVRPVVAGSQLPDAQVQVDEVTSLSLKEAVGSGKKILIVYRGGWCPYCSRHFTALGQHKEALSKRGWEMASLSPDAPATIKAWLDKNGNDGVPRLSDSDADAIRALGLAFVLDEATRIKYKKYNIDLEQASGGQTHYILPVPAVLLIVDGEIRSVHADADYSRRLHPEVLMATVDAVEADIEAAEKKK